MRNVQVPALEEVITSNECISQDVTAEEVQQPDEDIFGTAHFKMKIYLAPTHFKMEMTHFRLLTVSLQVRQEPYSLPDGFKWDTLLLDDPLVLKEVKCQN